jgi:flagellar basal body-associated protein FliL
MADDEILDEGEDEELNFVAIFIAAAVLLALIGGVVWYFFIREAPVEEQNRLPQWEAPEDLGAEYISDLLQEMIINPADSKGRYFLIVKIDVAVNDRDIIFDEVLSKKWRIPEIRNIIVDVISTYTMAELKTPEFKNEVREVIVEKLNELAGWTADMAASSDDGELILPPVKDIYFSKYILQ